MVAGLPGETQTSARLCARSRLQGGRLDVTRTLSAAMLMCLATFGNALAGQVQISWTDNSSNESGFKVERKVGTSGTFAQIGTTGIDVATYTDASAIDGTTYCYRVRAFNAAGDSGYSNEVCGMAAPMPTLTVTKAGSGTVTSTPAGIACGATCSASFSAGSIVSLTATAATGSTFSGWGGACTGTGACNVTLGSNTSVSATFALAATSSTYSLSVSLSGGSTGTVISSPAGISCGATCTAGFAAGTVVSLTATPAAGSSFAGWSGACSGATCAVTLSANQTVTARFVPLNVSLVVRKNGGGSGKVTGSPAGIDCGTLCAASYPAGTTVTLAESPDSGSSFGGWNGACTGFGSCVVTLTADTTITASFAKGRRRAKLLTGPGAGTAPAVQVVDVGQSTTLAVEGEASFFAYDPSFRGGVFVAAADLQGDGSLQIVTAPGPGGGPHVRVFNEDGSDFGVSFMAYDPSFVGGVRIASCDVDGDGRDEIITAPGPGGGPHIRVWRVNGAAVTELTGFFAYAATFTGGVFVACGDFDGDGRDEIVTAAGAGGGPHVAIWKIAPDGTVVPVAGFFAYDPSFAGGVFVAAGDLDGDGRDELITGPGPGGAPQVAIWSIDGTGTVTPFTSFLAYDPAFGGGVRVATVDWDGDGRADVVTAAGPGGGPHVMVWDSKGHDRFVPIKSFFAYDPYFTGGVLVGGRRHR
jgi:List-Bact-rpt repeat protein/VCBS repeat protein